MTFYVILIACALLAMAEGALDSLAARRRRMRAAEEE